MEDQAEEYPDFTLVARILYLANLTNQVKQVLHTPQTITYLQNNTTNRKVASDLEQTLLQFGLTLRVHVIGDPRTLLFASSLSPDGDTEDDTQQAYARVAQLMGFQDMLQVMNVFAEKLVYTLLYSNNGTEEGK
jgi:hypothetical protein